ncbi:hypothetical protein EUX98_g6148 [Antrodiella citrinella]|uniref:Uncharacterized protein n=1 Tax=Antrodiella citrinella TaxID=2447956 RepID=A0A4S4MPU7_9APHY|nr:hypothetical protein EUX98_g6148 [Antrodiella citrinella]
MFYFTQGLVNSFFPGSAFAAQSLNISDQSLSDRHVDLKNLVFGICCIIPFGTFNHRRSAHVVLEEPKVIIELAPGDLFFLPSASIHHENIPLADPDVELRKSMISYSAGALFRWIQQGFKAAPTNKTSAEKQVDTAQGDIRWLEGWRLFCTMN